MSSGVVSAYRVERIEQTIQAAAAEPLPWEEFASVAIESLAAVVPHEVICLASTDPRTGLFTATVKEGIDSSADDEFIRLEYAGGDVNHFDELARRPVGVGVLAEHTDGRPARSRRYRELLRPYYGLHHEMRAALRSNGRMWGTCTIYRAPGRPGFSPDEAEALARLETALAQGMRRTVLAPAAAPSETDSLGPAVLVTAPSGEIVQATELAEQRIEQIDDDTSARLPAPIAAAIEAARAGTSVAEQRAGLLTRTRAGEWLVVRAAPLRERGTTAAGSAGSPGPAIAVTIESADAASMFPLLVEAYGLSARERAVTDHVLRGASTAQITASLQISAYTVQDHLKSIFAKVGVGSRRELAAALNRQLPDPR